ncbi:MAG TPA: GH32 C-terminal domain-containing protein [Pseudolysinimonas sp.]
MKRPHITLSRRLALVFAAGLSFAALGAGVLVPAAHAVADTSDPADQAYRPYLHFTPEENWMNDPNGLVEENGTYHLFFQYNPDGNQWGNMSWGHATSTDLVHWKQQPLAIPHDNEQDIFSGSVVVDTHNSSGFGTPSNPPMVAIFTSAYTSGPHNGIQAQSLAYSTDHGQTWTKYSGNPVLDRGSANFRDPKVFWYQGTTESYWVMTAVEATQHRVLIYRSPDLKTWTYLSDFGPANATGGAWEMPDLFPLALDGNNADLKWVLTVNLNPGSVAGGSGGQYFVGRFDGTTFTSDTTLTDSSLPDGSTYADFDGADFGGWTTTGTAFGNAPASGAIDGQQAVSGFDGTGFANSFHGQDGATGTLTSPSFTINNDYVNFLVGGGDHPHVDGTQPGTDPPSGSELLFDGFEYPSGQSLTDNGWTLTGDFSSSLNPTTAAPGDSAGHVGQKLLNTFQGGPNGDGNVGVMTSPTFTIDKRYLSMLVGGGKQVDGQTLRIELVVDGNVVQTATGANDGALAWQSWDLNDLQGKQAQLRVDDQETGGWGSIALDNVVLGDSPTLPQGTETSVDLVVDGQVVRSATGHNAESLDWTSWNVSDLRGKHAQIEAVDDNTGGWGHLNLDQVMVSDTAAQTRLRSYGWIDWGRDYYASNTFNDVADGKRIAIGWMNNWDYGGDIPTTPWRSAMSLPRELTLQTVDGTPKLVQAVVFQVDELAKTYAQYQASNVAIPEGTHALPDSASGNVIKIDAVFSPGTAQQFGVVVSGSSDGTQGTPVGYDTTTGTVVVDRTHSGNVSFNQTFPSVESAPVTLKNGKIELELYVDRSSVETFAQGGIASITDQIFPDESSQTVSLYAEGGTAQLDSLTVTPLYGAMWDPQPVLSVPGAPTAVSATSTQAGTADVSWSAPTETGNTPITGYTVTTVSSAPHAAGAGGIHLASTAVSGPQTCTTPADVTACTVTGLAPGTAYSFVVLATNLVGDSPASDASDPVSVLGASGGGPTTTGSSTPAALAATGLGIGAGVLTSLLLLMGGIATVTTRRSFRESED